MDAHVQQLLCQVVGGFSPADEHGVAHGVGLEADTLQKGLARRPGGGKGQDVPRPDLEGAAGDGDLALPLHGADEDVRGDPLAQGDQVHAVQHVALRHLEFDHIGLSVGKGVDLQRRGQIEDARRLRGGLQLGVDDHGQPQLFPEIAHLPAVVRGAHPGDGGAVAHPLGHGAAQQVQLVGFGDGDEQIGVFNAGLLQNAVAGAVSHDAHDVIQVGQGLDPLGILVHHDDIVALPAQLLYQRTAHLAAAHDDDLQAALFLMLLSKHCDLSTYD